MEEHTLPFNEYTKRLYELEAKGDEKAYLEFIHKYSCLYEDPMPKETVEKFKGMTFPELPDDVEKIKGEPV